jgi:hypothetical protein
MPESKARSVPGVLVRRMRPMKARIAPRKTMMLGFGAVGGATRGIKLKMGTMTTTRPVRKADFDGVVWARPEVWKL